MDDYLGNFFEHSGQIVSFGTAAAVWLGLTALGAVVGGRHRVREATVLYGWAVVSFAFTTLGVFTPVPFTYVAAGLAGLAVVAGVVTVRRGEALLPEGSLRIALLAAPLLVLVSAMAASQWDEFSHWLISPRLVLTLDTLPDDSNKHLGGSLAAYPYGWHVITYLVSRLAGRLVENAGALVNVFLLLTFGLVAVRLIREGLGRGDEATKPGWGLLALGALLATLLNTTFVQKIVLTSYADTPTAVCVGFGAVLGWRMLDALARGKPDAANRLALQIGLVMLVLVNLKQATVVLFALVVGAVLLAGLRDPAIRVRDLAKTVPALILPAIVIYGVWRYYVTTALSGAELAVRPFDQWHIDLIGQILWKMLVVFSKKGAYLALMVVAVGFAVRAMIRFRTPFDRLAVIVGAVFIGYNAFLLFAYVSTFGQNDALRVASLWRYNMHLGPLGVAFAAYGLGMLWKNRVPGRFKEKRLAWLPVVLILIAPLVFAHKLRFDKHPPVPHFRAVGADVAKIIKPDDKLFIVDPQGSGESAMITRYELVATAAFKGYMGAFHPRTLATFRTIFHERDFSHVLVHSWTSEVLQVLGMELKDHASTLLKSDGKGGWTVQGTWNKP